jgi:quinol monooxygenase YgiN
MIKRIVKMSFKPENCEAFKIIFETNWKKIKGFEGCSHVELLQDINNPEIFFTYSIWESETSLNNYRNSDLFKNVWSATKQLFNQKPEAWSVDQLLY